MMSKRGNQEATKSHDQHDNEDELDGLASLPYFQRLTSFIRGSTRHWIAGKITVVDFRPLYAASLHHIQRQLADHIRRIINEDITDKQLRDIRCTLHDYTHALRDFEFIHSNRWTTHFVRDIAASRLDNGPGSKLQGALITELGLDIDNSPRGLFKDSDLLGSFDPKLMQSSLRRSLGTHRAYAIEDETRRLHYHLAAKRFAFAILGGLIIVAPMLVLSIGSVTLKTLAVISVSIFLFALGVALFSGAEPENLLAGTAAYAAVLVTLMETTAT